MNPGGVTRRDRPSQLQLLHVDDAGDLTAARATPHKRTSRGASRSAKRLSSSRRPHTGRIADHEGQLVAPLPDCTGGGICSTEIRTGMSAPTASTPIQHP